jgi:hypothetical protein
VMGRHSSQLADNHSAHLARRAVKIEDHLSRCGLLRWAQLLNHRAPAATVSAMHDDRLEIGVTFDSARGYIASAPELRAPVAAAACAGASRSRCCPTIP